MSNLFKNNKYLLFLFVLTFVIFLISSVFSIRIVFSDLACEFFVDLNNLTLHNHFLNGIFVDNFGVSRYIAIKMFKVIFFIFYPLCDNIQQLAKLYTFSTVLMPFLFLVSIFLITKRTKRYDVAIFSLMYYALFEIPYLGWIVRESHLAVMFQFLFMSYFFSFEKLKQLDYVLILLISLCLFESFESNFTLGLLFFIAGFLYYLKFKKDRLKQLLMGLIGLCFSLYVFFKTYSIVAQGDVPATGFLNAIDKWIHHVKIAFVSIDDSCMMFSVCALVIMIVSMFIKRKFNKYDLFWCLPLFALTTFFVFKNTAFIPDPSEEMNFFVFSLFVPHMLFLLLFILDISGKTISDVKLDKILVVSLITGLVQFFWQINSSIHCMNYFNEMQKHLESTDSVFSTIHFTDTPQACSYDSPNCAIFRSLIVQNDKKIQKILLPDVEHRDYHINFLRNTYYNEEKDCLFILEHETPIKTKYWDLTTIAEEFKDKNIEDFIKKEER